MHASLRHKTSQSFWSTFHLLNPDIQRVARSSFLRLKADPSHPSLHFKNVGRYWSARVGRQHRAVAVKRGDDFVWFWIGPHDEYDRLIG